MGGFILNACAETLAEAPVAQAVETAATSAQEPATWFVVVMGMGIVFIGLICLIILISIMGSIMKRFSPASNASAAAAPRAAAPAPAAAGSAIPNRSELVAAISVALAEELGTDVRAIRIHSIKRV